MTSVLLADDQALVRAGFRALIDAQGDLEVVGEASDGAEAVALTSSLKPDVVLMDIRMPNMDGLEGDARDRNRSCSRWCPHHHPHDLRSR